MQESRTRKTVNVNPLSCGYRKLSSSRTTSPSVWNNAKPFAYLLDSSINDYRHKPGTTFEEVLPLNCSDYYSNNPRYKYTKQSKVTWSITPGDAFTHSFMIRKYSYTIQMDGYAHNFIHPSILGYPHAYLASEGRIKGIGYIPSYTALVRPALMRLCSDSKSLNVEGLNILAFIGELREWKSLVDFFKLKFKDVKETTGSNKFLGYQFGVLPLLSDLQTMKDLWTKLPDAIRKWNDMASKSKRLDSHVGFDKEKLSGTVDVVLNESMYYDCPIRYTARLVYSQKRRGAAATYFTPLPITGKDGKDMTLEILGLTKPLSAVWQLMPYSFMVDWVTNIGDIIDKFETRMPFLKVLNRTGGWSYKQETEIKVETYVEYGPGYATKRSLDTRTYFRKEYVRNPLCPHELVQLQGYLPFEFKPEITGFQAILASAILHTRLRS